MQSDKKSSTGTSDLSQDLRLISFDVYFSKMLVQNPKVQKHHKAPMRQFAEQKGLTDGTEEQFDEIFRSY